MYDKAKAISKKVNRITKQVSRAPNILVNKGCAKRTISKVGAKERIDYEAYN